MFYNPTAALAQPFKDGGDESAFWGYDLLGVSATDVSTNCDNSLFDFEQVQVQWAAQGNAPELPFDASWVNSSAGTSANPSLSPVTPPLLYSVFQDNNHGFMSVCYFPLLPLHAH